jgi:hypothetical protein
METKVYSMITNSTVIKAYNSISLLFCYEIKQLWFEIYNKIFININHVEVFKQEKHYSDTLRVIRMVYFNKVVFSVLDIIGFDIEKLHKFINTRELIMIDKKIYYEKFVQLFNETIHYYTYLKANNSDKTFALGKKTNEYYNVGNMIKFSFNYFGVKVEMGREIFKNRSKIEQFIQLSVNCMIPFRTQKQRYKNSYRLDLASGELEDRLINDNFDNINPKVKLVSIRNIERIMDRNILKYISNNNKILFDYKTYILSQIKEVPSDNESE